MIILFEIFKSLKLGTSIRNSAFLIIVFQFSAVLAGDVLNNSSAIQLGAGRLGEASHWEGFLNPSDDPDDYATSLKNFVGFYASVERDNNFKFQDFEDQAREWYPSYSAVMNATGLPSTSSRSWTKMFYPVHPTNRNMMGESFLHLNDESGIGIYAQSNGEEYRPKGTQRYIFGSGKGHSIAIANMFNKSEYRFYPWTAADGDSAMKVGIESMNLKQATYGYAGACRLNFAIKFDCVDSRCTGKKDPEIVVHGANAYEGKYGVNDDQGFIPEGYGPEGTIYTQYNIVVQDKVNVHKHYRTGRSIAESKAGATAISSKDLGKTRNISLYIRFSHFRNILREIARVNIKGSKSDDQKAAEFYGDGWSSKKSWVVKGIAVRMEITPDGSKETKCGASFRRMTLNATK